VTQSDAPSPVDSTAMPVRNSQLTPEEDVRLLTGIETAVGWVRGRTEVSARTGVAIGLRQRPARWGEMRAAYWTLPSLAVFASLKTTQRVDERLESVQGDRASLGIQLVPGRPPFEAAPARPAFEERCDVVHLGDGRTRLTLHVRARTIEIMSETTAWAPVPATRIAANEWEAELVLEPGLHRIAMRIDGGRWRAPPGLPAAADDFGGEVGLLVVD
jgi:hypothetical protein